MSDFWYSFCEAALATLMLGMVVIGLALVMVR